MDCADCRGTGINIAAIPSTECPDCKGDAKTCGRCAGSGRIPKGRPCGNCEGNGTKADGKRCGACMGTGREITTMVSGNIICQSCFGTGKSESGNPTKTT
jgi:hypothetical protein